MKTIEVKVYNFDELSNEAKCRAKNNFEHDDFWAIERMNSKKAADDIYQSISPEETISGVRLYKYIQNNVMPKLRNYKYYSRKSAYFADYSHGRAMKQKYRFSKIQFSEDQDNLTGYCDDYEFLAPLFDFMKNPSDNVNSDDLRNTNTSLIYQKISESEYENFLTDENFSEYCTVNDMLFYENGDIY